jgi:B12 binding domain
MITELRGRPAYTPPTNLSYGRPPSTLNMGDAFSVYSNPDPQSTRVVTLIAPPLFFSKNSYSTPLTMPLGLAYLAAVLEKAHYRVKIVDCPGSDANRISLTPNGRFKVQGLDEQQSIELIDRDTDIIGVSIMFSQEWPQVRDYINRIRRAFPHAKIIVGG